MNALAATTTLPADVEALMRQLRLPHARAIAADVLATARSQRWDPTEVIKALLTEETTGRARSMLATRRKAWFTLEQIGVLVRAHRADDSLTKANAKIVRAELVVIDDVGLLPVGTDAAEGLYRIVEAAYERKSVVPNQRRIRAADPGTARTGGQSPALTTTDHRWRTPPIMGRFVAATGQFLLATHRQFSWPPVGNFRWPLTRDRTGDLPPFRSTFPHRRSSRVRSPDR